MNVEITSIEIARMNETANTTAVFLHFHGQYDTRALCTRSWTNIELFKRGYSADFGAKLEVSITKASTLFRTQIHLEQMLLVIPYLEPHLSFLVVLRHKIRTLQG